MLRSVLGAKSGDTQRKRALFITPTAPWKGESGGLQVSRDRLRHLEVVFDVSVLHLSDGKAGSKCRQPNLLAKTFSAGCSRRRSHVGLLRSYAANLPLSVWRNADGEFLSLAKTLSRAQWDLVYADHWLVWQAASYFTNSYRVLHLHNAEHKLFSRAADHLLWPVSWVARLEAERVRLYLTRIFEEANEVHLLSHDDECELKASRIFCSQTLVFPPSASIPTKRHAKEEQKSSRRAVFVGSLSWLPNEEGAKWFLQDVWPHVRSVEQFDVVGKGAGSELRQMIHALPAVNGPGFVADLDSLYARSKVFVAPLLSGSGVKIKILNALANGLPVITTRIGAEGFPLDGQEPIIVEDDAAAFAKSLDRLMTDDTLWEEMRGRIEAYLRQYFNDTAFQEWCAVHGS